MERWAGRVAVVTGASEGIGQAIVRQLAARGMKVAALARREHLLKELEKELTSRKLFVRGRICDVTKEEEVKEAFDWVEKNLGPVSVLVNNAACFKPIPLPDMDLAAVTAMVDTNLSGVFQTTAYGLQSMKKNNITDGHIININSILGHRDYHIKGLGPYTATKHGITLFNTALKRELGEENSKIRVTSLSPGLVSTSMGEYFIKEHEDWPYLEGQDIAEAVVYVLSTPPHVNITELTIEPVKN